MPAWAKILISIVVAGALCGGLLLWSGIVNVAASTGHWKLTEFVLHTAMRRSVQTHSMGIEVPPLDDPGLVRRGAGHYAASCVDCHGAPGVPRAADARAMVPQPPLLREKVREWKPQELFWIVRHGVKFTGMPAWPALEREDEIWAMVAFVLRLPELDAAEYHRLVFGAHAVGKRDAAAEAGDPVMRALDQCSRCHGRSGRGSGAFPRIAGQRQDYLAAGLIAYKRGFRKSGIMQMATSTIDEAVLRELAAHYASQAAPDDLAPSVEPRLRARGERLARAGDSAAGIPACMTCHGLGDGPRYSAYPVLAGQEKWYLSTQLRLFRRGARGGSAYEHIMRAVARRLDDGHIAAVAAFYASLPGRNNDIERR